MAGTQENQTCVDAPNVNLSIGTEKKCTKCGHLKQLSEYYLRNGKYISQCKECCVARSRNRREKSPEKVRAEIRAWRLNNPDRAKAAIKIWEAKNKERAKKSRHLWYLENSEKIKCKAKEWGRKNPEKLKKIRQKVWGRKKSTAKGRIWSSMTKRINKSLRGNKNGRHWEDLMDYTVNQLKEHLERRFKPSMTWENYGTYWHIDHVIPVSAFNFETTSDIDFKKCWSLNNLQPLEAKENQSKGAKIKKPFQPSLLIGG